jgi:hypothetical protein
MTFGWNERSLVASWRLKWTLGRMDGGFGARQRAVCGCVGQTAMSRRAGSLVPKRNCRAVGTSCRCAVFYRRKVLFVIFICVLLAAAAELGTDSRHRRSVWSLRATQYKRERRRRHPPWLCVAIWALSRPL